MHNHFVKFILDFASVPYPFLSAETIENNANKTRIKLRNYKL